MSLKLGLGLGVNSGGKFYTYQSETKTLFAALTGSYSLARKKQMDKMIKSLKTAGVWAKLDVLQMYAAPTAADAVVNWKAPGTFNATLVNSPTVETDRGIKCGSVGMSINSGYNPTTAAINLTLDSATYFFYKRENAGANYDIVSEIGSGVLIRYASSTGFRLHSGDATVTAPSRKDGFQAIVRESSTIGKNYAYNSVDTGLITEVPNSSVLIPNADISVGGSTLFGAVNAQFSLFGAGSQLSATELGNLKDALETYLDYIGAGVIP